VSCSDESKARHCWFWKRASANKCSDESEKSFPVISVNERRPICGWGACRAFSCQLRSDVGRRVAIVGAGTRVAILGAGRRVAIMGARRRVAILIAGRRVGTLQKGAAV
jgi:hypothetical protein